MRYNCTIYCKDSDKSGGENETRWYMKQDSHEWKTAWVERIEKSDEKHNQGKKRKIHGKSGRSERKRNQELVA